MMNSFKQAREVAYERLEATRAIVGITSAALQVDQSQETIDAYMDALDRHDRAKAHVVAVHAAENAENQE